ncbi:MAG: PQQ-dependent sugar dehydrogenase, partial [Chitinophagaceae bacterium]|nr:PQQ-dependent sugar dehydrogenase [Chitinophagaceae bacterium]
MQQVFVRRLLVGSVLVLSAIIHLKATAQVQPVATRTREVFRATTLYDVDATGNTNNGGWEIIYEGVEDSLWITENREYRIRKIAPNSANSGRVILNLASGATQFPTLNRTFAVNANPWPQGGMMGMALHPRFLAATNPKNFVYVAYVRQYVGQNQTVGSELVNGYLFYNSIVRFTYNATTKALEAPEIIIDTLRGSNDHNSGRLTIAPVDGVDYLFYASGDMGSGQFWNAARTMKAQWTESYEGKVLRFNLEKDTDADQGSVDYNQWIPNNNPYNNQAPVVGQSAVWNIGHRNIQGFAYANGKLYAGSHGQFSDDELNILERGKNYGHPGIQGYAFDGNYNNARASRPNFSGFPDGSFSPAIPTVLPIITSEVLDSINTPNYKTPIYSYFAAPNGPDATPNTVRFIYLNNPSNQGWPSIAPSGMDIYNLGRIPGWNNSIIQTSLKKGFLMRQKLSADGNSIIPIDGFDTAVVLHTLNRYRDIAFGEDGRTIYATIDGSGSTSGPTSTTPVNSPDEGQVIRYTFIGYNDVAGKSNIPSYIPIGTATNNSCQTLQGATINATNNNNNIWVPITDDEGNIIAEVNGRGNNLGAVTASVYKNGSTVREDAARRLYLDRNITISVGTQPTPGNPAGIRFYLTNAEFTALQNASNSAGFNSGVTNKDKMGIYKNNTNTCQTAISGVASAIAVDAVDVFGASGYVITADVESFSTFFVANNSAPLLPISIKNLKASWLANQGLVQ